MGIKERADELTDLFNLDEKESLLLTIALKNAKLDGRIEALEEYGARLSRYLEKIETYENSDRLHDYPESFINGGE